ncbi:MAG: hypothetical protein V3T86_13195 [Planctomycetota bacterium]
MTRRTLSWSPTGLGLLFAIASIGCGSTPTYEKTYEVTLTTPPKRMEAFTAAKVKAVPVYVLLCDSTHALDEAITKDPGKFQTWFQTDDELKDGLGLIQRIQLVVYKPGEPPEDPIELNGETLTDGVKLWVLANFPNKDNFEKHSASFPIPIGSGLEEIVVEIANNEVKIVKAED